MPRHSETRYLPYSAEQMYALVADVAHYPEFLPWVIALRVREDSETLTVADMIVGFKGLRETFTSEVNKTRPSAVDVRYVSGPLKHLVNEWRFADVEGGKVRVDFMVDFAFRNALFEAMAGQMFDKALRKMIGAFEERAAVLYGAGSV